jgi:hypothetical protein
MLFIADFMRDFHVRLHEIAPEDVKRDIVKHERVVKHTLYMVMGQHEHFRKEDAARFQELFHVRIDQMASDYATWKRAGCKPYARPKQYVSGRVAGASKKAFDQVLNSYLLRVKEMQPLKERISELSLKEAHLKETSLEVEPLADFNTP